MIRNISTDCQSYLPGIDPMELPVITVNDLFGPSSVLSPVVNRASISQAAEVSSLFDTIYYKLIIIFTFLLFGYVVYVYREYISEIFKAIFKGLTVEKLYGLQVPFLRQFVMLCSTMGVLLAGGLIVIMAQMLGFVQGVDGLVLIGIIYAMIFCVMLYRRLFLWLATIISKSKDFFALLRFQNNLISISGYIVLTPLFLLMALNIQTLPEWLIYFTLGLLGAVYLVYLYKSWKFFICGGVSILQWISYLCAVEIFPLSFFVLLGLRTQG